MTPVIFRKDRTGEITAVFPTLPADTRGLHMTCYAHIGQHGACAHAWYSETQRATPEDHAPLLAELRGIYDDLVIYQRITPGHRAALKAALP
jgi:hypothetical protein